ncbi:bath-42 [Symbiodinium natans]|uniref:Bath-42 protein n=1 Tax=Symbiodinium natans TaxID=878477 RepID=A0A812NQR7_9DINO|nr:bath-42 [Symbiodinium natans]
MSKDAQQRTDTHTCQRSERTADSMAGTSDIELHFGVDSMRASSALLRAASPVFDGMLGAGMAEAQQRVIKVEVASKTDFELFYRLLFPASRKGKVGKKNVDALLAISDYYQVDFLKEACEKKLLRLPATVDRLIQAHKHGLKRQYQRCLSALALESKAEDMARIRHFSADILLDLVVRGQEVRTQNLQILRLEITSLQRTAVDSMKPVPSDLGPASIWNLTFAKDRDRGQHFDDATVRDLSKFKRELSQKLSHVLQLLR